MDLDALFRQPNALPSAPEIVLGLIGSFTDENISAHDIARKLADDPVLSAKLLRLANSAFYQVSRSVNTVNDAVLMLGFSTVRTVVISSGLVNSFKSAPGLDLEHFWRYSLNAAVAAKWLAKQVNEDPELAFTIGMMHGIGQLIIHVGIPELASTLDQSVSPMDPRRMDAERNALGYDHAEVGAELAVRWKFPEVFSAVIRAFPRPLEQQPFMPMAGVIHMAAWLSRTNENIPATGGPGAVDPTEVAARLGVDVYRMSDGMPPLPDLCNGLEELLVQ